MWKRYASKRPTSRHGAPASRTRGANSYRPKCENLEDRSVPSILFSSTGSRSIVDTGGPILRQMQVDLIFWGAHWNDAGANQTLRTNVQNTVNAILTSTYFDGLSQYRSIIHGSVLRSDTITSSSPGATFQTATNGDLATMVANNINNGTLPAPNSQLLYFVVPQPGSTASDCGCVGRHLAAFASGNRVFPYGVTNNPTGVSLDTLSVIISHELAEAATNPQWNITVGGVSQAAFHVPGSNGDEIGDGEAQNYTYRLNGALIQAYLSQRDHAYIVTNGSTNTFLVSSTRVLTLTTTFVGNQFFIGLVGNGVAAELNSSTAQFEPGAISSVQVTAPSGLLQIAGTPVPVNVQYNGANAQVDLGNSTNGVQDIHGVVNLQNSNGRTTVDVDDSGNRNGTTARQMLPGAGFDIIHGLAPADIMYRGVQTGAVYIFLGSGPNTFTVENTNTAGLVADPTTLSTGTGSALNTVNVLATDRTTPLNVVGRGSNATVSVGDPTNGVRGIQGAVTVSNSAGSSTGLVIDDSHGSGTQTATINTFTSGTQYMSVSGLSLGAINSQCAAGKDLVVYTGTGAVTTDVLATCGHGLNLHGNSPNTTVNVGNAGSLAGIQALEMTISNRNGDTGVAIDDHNRSGTRTVTADTVVSDTQYASLGGSSWIPGTIYSQCAASKDLAVYTGTGAVTTDVLATCGHGLNLHGNSPNTTVNVGNAGSLAGIQSLEMTISNTDGDTGVVIDDHNRGGARSATFDTVVSNTRYVSLNDLIPGTIYSQCAASRDVDVYTGTGAVTTNVLATCGHGLNLHGNSPNTTVNVGNAGSLAGIQALEMTITDPGGRADVTVDDRNDSTSHTPLLSTDPGDATYGQITGLTSTTIYYRYAETSTLVVFTGIATATVNVQATGTNVDLGGNDAQGLTINLGNAGSVQEIRGAMSLSNDAGPLNINFNDQNDTMDRNVMLDDFNSGREFMRLVGLAPTTIFSTTDGGGNYVVNGGRGTNIFSVASTSALVTTTINGGAGVNEFVVQPSADQAVLGPLAFHGLPGSNSYLFYDDQSSPTAQAYTLTADTLSRSGLAPVTFDNLNQVILLPATVGGNTINVPSVAAGVLANLAAADGDTVTIGADQSLAAILGPVVVDPLLDNISASVVIDASADPTPAGPITFSSSPSWDFQISGLAPEVIRFGVLQNTTLNTSLLTGAGDKTFSMLAASQGMALSLDAGSGTNTLDYSNDAGNVLANFQTGEFTGFSGVANIQNVIGGQGANILVGDGNENLTGGTGHNLIISGGGSGQLTGGGAGDILIGGTTAYDTDDASLQAILTYWTTSGDDYPTRVANLRAGNGVPQLEGGITVFDNGAANTLTGNGSEDQGLFNLFYVTEAGTVTDQQPDEVVVDIDNPGGVLQPGDHGNPGGPSRESLLPAAAADLYFLRHGNETEGVNVSAEPTRGRRTSAGARILPTVRATGASLAWAASPLGPDAPWYPET